MFLLLPGLLHQYRFLLYTVIALLLILSIALIIFKKYRYLSITFASIYYVIAEELSIINFENSNISDPVTGYVMFFNSIKIIAIALAIFFVIYVIIEKIQKKNKEVV